MGDPNWLYSSIVQSSAALVAILGGFVTASLLGRLSTRDDLQSQLNVLRKRRQLAETQRTERQREWFTARIEDAIDTAVDNLYKDQHRSLSIHDARRAIDLAENIPDELFAGEWNAYVDKINRWLDRIQAMDAESLPGTFESIDDWLERNDIHVSDRSWTILNTIVVKLQGLLQQKLRDKDR